MRVQSFFYLFLTLILFCLLGLQTSAQSILGKHPDDEVLPLFFEQNGNANTTIQGLNANGTVPFASGLLANVQEVLANQTVAMNISGNAATATAAATATNLGVAQNLFGNTNAFYALLSYFDVVNNPSYREAWYLCESTTPPYTNWFPVSRNPVYVDPDWYTNGDLTGPTVACGGSAIEVGGMLYAVYDVQANVSAQTPMKAAISIAATSDLTNWVRIATWTNSDSWPQTWSGAAQWSTVNFGGTNWIVFNLNTNQDSQDGYQFGNGEVLPVSLSGYNATFGQPVVITPNHQAQFTPSTSIVTNNAGDFILTSALNGNSGLLYSTNFFGPYTNQTAWSLPSTVASISWIQPVTNQAVWLECCGINGGNYLDMMEMELSTNFGTNWTVLSSSVYNECPALAGLAPQQFDPFQLTTPLTNFSSGAVTGSDASFTGTGKFRALDAQVVQAKTLIANNLIVGGQAAGTIHAPFTVRGNMTVGNGCSNMSAAFGDIVMGMNVSRLPPSVGAESAGGSFIGGSGYVSQERGPVFLWEDGTSPENSPLGINGIGGFSYSQKGFCIISQNIIFGEGLVNSYAGFAYQAAPGYFGFVTNLDGTISAYAGGIITNVIPSLGSVNGAAITNVNFSSLNFSSFVPGPFTNVIVGYLPLWTNNGTVYCVPVGTNL